MACGAPSGNRSADGPAMDKNYRAVAAARPIAGANPAPPSDRAHQIRRTKRLLQAHDVGEL